MTLLRRFKPGSIRSIAVEQFEKIRTFAIMQNDFSNEVRSVTVFQKIKVDRKAVEQRYQKEIEKIYGLAEERKA